MIFSREIALFHLFVLCGMHLLKMRDTIFLFCPSFAALCEILFAYAAHLLGDRWWTKDFYVSFGF